MIAYHCIGGSYHNEKVAATRIPHGGQLRLPKDDEQITTGEALAAAFGRKQAAVREVEWENYVAYYVATTTSTGARRGVWYAFYDSLGIDGGTPFFAVFEFLLEFYITHSEWGENL